MDNASLTAKKARCEELVSAAGTVLVAFSGGVDSTLVAAVARRLLGDRCAAATAVSASLSRAGLQEAVDLAKAIGITHHLVPTGEVALPEYRANSPRRCYFCKSTAYDLFTRFAQTGGFAVVMDGTNADDTGDHRPGRVAAQERGVRSPLQEAGLTKAEVRAWAKELDLPNWDKPAAACLASRVPYGMEVTPEKLSQIEAVESALHAQGFRQCRVRHHGSVARVEVDAPDLPRAFAERAAICAAVKAAGFQYGALDLDGFRSGSLNEVLAPLPPIRRHVS